MLNRGFVLLAFSASLMFTASGLFADVGPINPFLPAKGFDGLNLGPYLNDPYQEPGQPGRPPLSTEQLQDRVDRILPFTNWIRTYSTSDGQDWISPSAAHSGKRRQHSH